MAVDMQCTPRQTNAPNSLHGPADSQMPYSRPAFSLEFGENTLGPRYLVRSTLRMLGNLMVATQGLSRSGGNGIAGAITF